MALSLSLPFRRPALLAGLLLLAFSALSTPRPVVACTIPGMGHQIWSKAAEASWSFFKTL